MKTHFSDRQVVCAGRSRLPPPVADCGRNDTSSRSRDRDNFTKAAGRRLPCESMYMYTSDHIGN